MSRSLIIYGAGGLGREVKSMLRSVGEPYNLLGFLDDGQNPGTMVDDVEVLGGIKWLELNSGEVDLVVAIGNPKIKSKVVKDLQKYDNVNYPVLIHDRVTIQDRAQVFIGGGSIICAGVVITTGVNIGSHALLNLNVTVGHDSRIGSCSSIMPGANLAGDVTLGNEVMVGMGANIINKITVGNFSVIGAGSVVNHSIPPASTAAGVPARVIR